MTSKNISSHVRVIHCCKCNGDTKYYCLTCEKHLCPECKINHSIHLDTKEHDIRLYKYKNIIHCTREPCKEHPSQGYEMYCYDCGLPFCVDCTEHKDHSVRDVMTVYKEHKEIINNISRNNLYNLQVLLSIINGDYRIFKTKMDSILSEMTRELHKVKDHLDIVSVHEYISTKEIKRSLIEMLQKQTTSMNKHLSKLKISDTSKHKSAHKPVEFIRSFKKTKFPHIKMTPVRVQYFLLSVVKVDVRSLIMLLNDIQYTERGKRSVKNEHLLRLMSVPELQKSSTFKRFTSCEHISGVTRDQVWISERNKLVLIDIPTGKSLHTLNNVVDGFGRGLHTVNINHDLFYISYDNSIIKLSNDRETSTIFRELKSECTPLSLYCSPFTSNLLIGMHLIDMDRNIERIGCVARFNETGEFTQVIPIDYTHNTIFKNPDYITENNNGDVVVSDYGRGLVVTDHEGNHRFSYTETPFGSRLLPRGICTDALSNILVCDCYTDTVQILDKGGRYLLYICVPTEKSLGPLGKPSSLSYDWNTHQLWVGSLSCMVSRYRHINRHLDLTDNKEIYTDNSSKVPRCLNNPMHLEKFPRNYSQIRDFAEDICNLVLNLVLPISHQTKETAKDRQIIEVELD